MLIDVKPELNTRRFDDADFTPAPLGGSGGKKPPPAVALGFDDEADPDAIRRAKALLESLGYTVTRD